MNHWLVKQEPASYSWQDFVSDGRTVWDGVRNFQARNNLRGMKRGDRVLFYASGDSKSVVGTATVEKEAFPDPSAEKGDWSAVEFKAGKPLKKPVSLETIKKTSELRDLPLIRNTRLSVVPLTRLHFDTILRLGGD